MADMPGTGSPVLASTILSRILWASPYFIEAHPVNRNNPVTMVVITTTKEKRNFIIIRLQTEAWDSRAYRRQRGGVRLRFPKSPRQRQRRGCRHRADFS